MNDSTRLRAQELTLHMEGAEADGGDLQLSVFVQKLDSLRAALQESDRLVRGDAKGMDFIVSDLSHNSPAAVTVTGGCQVDGPQVGEVFDYLSGLISGLNAHEDRNRTSVFLLEKILELCNGYGDKISRMWLSRSGETVASIDAGTKESVLAILGRTIHATGSVKGTVEKYSSHGKEMYFYLYPLVGERVKCFFDEDQRNDAAQAVEKNVTVSGRLSYYEGQYFPYQMHVDAINISSDEANVSLASLIGAAPNATGEQSSTEFIRGNRDEWH